ncbi:MAG: preprotein translocase subunit Sec61beta [Desulfurococcales archaeon]
MSVKKKKREGPGPATAAGLVSFYRDVEPIVQLKPLLVILISSAFVISVFILRLFINPFS